MTRKKLLDLFTRALAMRCGFDVPGSQAQISNNPGGLPWWGSEPVVGGMVVFETEQDGWDALRRACEINIFRRGLTFEEFFGGRPGKRGRRYRGFSSACDSREAAETVFQFFKRRAKLPPWANTGTKVSALLEW